MPIKLLGRAMRAVRLKYKLSKADAAADLDLKVRYIERLEAGELTGMRLDTFLKILDYVDVDLKGILAAKLEQE